MRYRGYRNTLTYTCESLQLPHTPIATSTDAPNREENYAKKASEFEHHSKRMADTAATLAKTGGVTDRKMANDLISTSGKVSIDLNHFFPSFTSCQIAHTTVYVITGFKTYCIYMTLCMCMHVHNVHVHNIGTYTYIKF